jgi:hypothetical protein
MRSRTLAALLAGAALALGTPLLWRWFARTTNTQVHRINQ